MSFNFTSGGSGGGGFAFGGVEPPAFGAPANNEKKAFNFTSPTSSATPAFGSGLTFGAPTTNTTNAPGSLFPSPGAPAGTTAGMFGGTGANKPPAFGGFGTTGATSPFGQTTQAQVTPQQGGLNMSFGGGTTATQPTLGFGQPTATSAPASTGISFASPGSAAGSFPGFKTPATGFSAAPQQPAQPAAAAVPGAFAFGGMGQSKGLSFGTTTTGTGLSFASPATTAGSGLSFGAPQTTAGGLGFGSPTSTATGGLGASAFSAPTGGLSFGTPGAASAPSGVSFATTTSAPTGLSFGTAPATQAGLNFGATTAAPTTGLSFGTTPTTGALSFGTTPPTTGGISFGTTAPTTGGLSFGTAPATTGGSFGTTSGLSFAAPAPSAGGIGATVTTSAPATGLNFGATPALAAAPLAPASGFSFAPASSAGGLTLSTPAATTATGATFAAPVSSTATGLNFKATPASTVASTTAGTTFQLGGKSPATALSGFSLPTTSAPASTAATAVTSGITALGQPATAAHTTASLSLTTAATTTPVMAPQPVASLTFAQLEENINKWTLQLEEQEKLFINQATQINAWDRLLIENGEKIVELNSAVQAATNEQQAVEHELEFIVAQQRELEELLAPIERELAREQRGREPEREHMYQLAETLDTQLKQMSEDLKEVIQHLNDTNRSQDGNDPIVQIGRILNAHMSSMQWVDNSIAQISTKLDQLKTTHDVLRRDNERSFHLTYD